MKILHSKIEWQGLLSGALIGYLVLHPLVMISGHLMLDSKIPDLKYLLDIIAYQTGISFSFHMLPWSLTFSVLGALLGIYYGRMRLAQIELEQHRDRLESAIAERTQMLESANARLNLEIQQNKRNEIALRESEKKYRTIFDCAPVGVALTTVDGRLLACNDMLLKMTGYSRPEAEQRNAVDVYYSPEARTQILDQLERHGTIREMEVQLKRKDDSFFFASVTMTLLEQDHHKVLFTIAHDITQRKRAQDKLKKSEAALRQLSSQLLHAQETERKRIARELHDSIGQSLSAIKFCMETTLNDMVESGVSRTALQPLETMVPLAETAIEEVRRIVMDLRPSTLDDLGILATINWFCSEFKTIYSGIRIEQDIRVVEEEVPPVLKTVIYRVLQEAFNNIAKHSRASLIRLSLKLTDDRIEMSITDNGKGFYMEGENSFAPLEKSFGLAGMKERTELFGGTFFIDSVKAYGTMIRSSWPLKQTLDAEPESKPDDPPHDD